MRKILLFFFIINLFNICHAQTNQVSGLFKAKKFDEIVRIYDKNKNSSVYGNSKEITLQTAIALERGNRPIDVVHVLMKVIRAHEMKNHKILSKAIKDDESVDPSDFPKSVGILYWNVYKNYGLYILGFDDKDKVPASAFKSFNHLKKFLDQLEFKEKESDKLNDQVSAHLKSLEEKVYQYNFSMFLEYLSWQTITDLKIGTDTSDVVSTNQGTCVGVEMGLRNSNYHYFLDGCMFMASASVKANSVTAIEYQQNLSFMGVKTSLGAGMTVSPNKAEIGIKIPVMFSSQKLTEPPSDSPDCVAGCKVDQPSSLSVATMLYGRWSLEHLFFQTELGKFINNDSAIWSLRAGYKF